MVPRSINQNILIILKLLAEASRNEDGESWMSPYNLVGKNDLTVTEINDAISILEKKDYVELDIGMGSAPYNFNGVQITALGRHKYEELLNTSTASETTTKATINVITNFWEMLHPRIVKVARTRYESGHFADAVEAALKEINSEVKVLYGEKKGNDRDGADLMFQAFSLKDPVVLLSDLKTETDKNIQEGYMYIFAGAIKGIRNPKAHENIEIDEVRATHHLFLASLLCYKLDERLQ